METHLLTPLDVKSKEEFLTVETEQRPGHRAEQEEGERFVHCQDVSAFSEQSCVNGPAGIVPMPQTWAVMGTELPGAHQATSL